MAKPNSNPKPEVKPDHGIPEHVIELFGPPAVLPHRIDQFYLLLGALEQEHHPRGTADWCNLWDAALARTELKQIGSAKVVATALHYDRAAKEITLTDSLRLVGQTQDKPRGRDPTVYNGHQEQIEDLLSGNVEPPFNISETYEHLKRLNLPTDTIWDVAYILSGPTNALLEELSIIKINVERTSFQDFERRHDRLDRRRSLSDTSPIIEAEFSSAAAQPGVQGLMSPSASPPTSSPLTSSPTTSSPPTARRGTPSDVSPARTGEVVAPPSPRGRGRK